MKLAISLIEMGSFQYMLPTLHNLRDKTTLPYQVYLVLNTPQLRDHPKLQEILTAFPDIQVIVNDSPKGFAANHNQVMRVAQTEFVALLNDDIELQNAALDILVQYLEAHPSAGLVGPQLYNHDGSRQVSVYSDPSLLRVLYKISGLATLTHQQSHVRKLLLRLGVGKLTGVKSLREYNSPTAVDIIKGAVMVVRREAYESVGLMSEATRSYGEEQDWHLRMRRAGWDVVIVPDAKITHFGMGQVLLKLKGNLLAEDRKANLLYFVNYRPRWQAWLVRVAIIGFHSLWGIALLPFSHQRSKAHFSTAKVGLMRFQS